MVERSRALADFIVHDELVAAPPTSLNVQIGGDQADAASTVPLDDLKEIKHALGGTVNDVVLAACAGGLRRLLRAAASRCRRRASGRRCRSACGEASELLALGNRVTSLFVDLPVSARDPAARATGRRWPRPRR